MTIIQLTKNPFHIKIKSFHHKYVGIFLINISFSNQFGI